MIVTTPSKMLSIHYTLGEKGDKVLLFLNKNDEKLYPLSPQGVSRCTKIFYKVALIYKN